jgi:hypothetical protein
VDEIVKQYGESVRDAAMKMRDLVKDKIGILRSPEDADRVARALVKLLSVISRTGKQ